MQENNKEESEYISPVKVCNLALILLTFDGVREREREHHFTTLKWLYEPIMINYHRLKLFKHFF
jgi:hypothetical protein